MLISIALRAKPLNTSRATSAIEPERILYFFITLSFPFLFIVCIILYLFEFVKVYFNTFYKKSNQTLPYLNAPCQNPPGHTLPAIPSRTSPNLTRPHRTSPAIPYLTKPNHTVPDLTMPASFIALHGTYHSVHHVQDATHQYRKQNRQRLLC